MNHSLCWCIDYDVDEFVARIAWSGVKTAVSIFVRSSVRPHIQSPSSLKRCLWYLQWELNNIGRRLTVINSARFEVVVAVCWRFGSPGIWRCVPTFRKRCRLRISRSTIWPQRWRHYDSSKCREVLIQRQHHVPEEMNLQTVIVLQYVFANCVSNYSVWFSLTALSVRR
jgi:hypothetical protein